MPKVDASIAFSATDNLSQSIVGMRNSLNTMKSDVQGLQKQLDALDSKHFQLKNFDLKRARKELQTAQKEFDRLSKSAEDADKKLAAEKTLRAAQTKYENIRRQVEAVGKQARQTEKDLMDLEITSSRTDNRAAGSARMTTVDALIAGGIGDMAADAAMEIANTYVSSAYGQSVGGIVSSTLSGAVSGAAIGTMINPGLGTAVGGLVGGAVGAVTGGSQVYASRDEAFKSYVQEAAEGQLAARDEAISSGSATAAQRELDAIAFNQLLYGQGDEFLEGLRQTAARTPFEYADLTTMARNLATGFGTDPERMLELMTAIGDAGAAVGASTADMQWMATALSRMQSTNLAQLGEINMFQDRGVDVIGALARAYGVDEGAMRSMISGGEVGGRDAVDIIQAALSDPNGVYAGSMNLLAETFSGLTSTLEDAEAELNNAYGEGYNAAREEGLQEQIDWLDSGAMEEANRAIGAWRAELENERERYEREAVDAVMASEEYRTAEAEGDAAEMGRLLMQAKVEGMNRYNASEGAQLALESELALAEGIRENTRTDDAYWDAGWRKGEQYSKGLAEGILSNPVVAGLAGLGESRSGVSSGGGATYTVDDVIGGARSLLEHLEEFGSSRSNAYGLRRVPYDGYAALLHEGERVLTAREARAMDRGGAGNVTVNITGSWSVRSDADVDAVAEALYRRIRTARMGGVRT